VPHEIVRLPFSAYVCVVEALAVIVVMFGPDVITPWC
jgi:hypothetical protein